jgi:hypothetical protein
MDIEIKKKAAPQHITAWSYSRLSEWEGCPKKSYFKVIEKLKEPGSEAMERGSKIHKEGENFLKGLLEEVPETYKLLAQELAEVKMLGAKSEVEATFTKDWQSCGWFDAEAYLRIKIDIVVAQDGVIRLIDIKTGKNKGGDTYKDQLELYALAAMLIFPDISGISAELWFVDSGEIIGTSAYKPSQLEELKARWEKRIVPMMNDTIFAPRPSSACKWCWFSQSKTGKCEY